MTTGAACQVAAQPDHVEYHGQADHPLNSTLRVSTNLSRRRSRAWAASLSSPHGPATRRAPSAAHPGQCEESRVSAWSEGPPRLAHTCPGEGRAVPGLRGGPGRKGSRPGALTSAAPPGPCREPSPPEPSRAQPNASEPNRASPNQPRVEPTRAQPNLPEGTRARPNRAQPNPPEPGRRQPSGAAPPAPAHRWAATARLRRYFCAVMTPTKRKLCAGGPGRRGGAAAAGGGRQPCGRARRGRAAAASSEARGRTRRDASTKPSTSPSRTLSQARRPRPAMPAQRRAGPARLLTAPPPPRAAPPPPAAPCRPAPPWGKGQGREAEGGRERGSEGKGRRGARLSSALPLGTGAVGGPRRAARRRWPRPAAAEQPPWREGGGSDRSPRLPPRWRSGGRRPPGRGAPVRAWTLGWAGAPRPGCDPATGSGSQGTSLERGRGTGTGASTEHPRTRPPRAGIPPRDPRPSAQLPRPRGWERSPRECGRWDLGMGTETPDAAPGCGRTPAWHGDPRTGP